MDRQWQAHIKTAPTFTNLTTFVQVRKTKRSHESVAAFQRALVLIVSLKQLFSSHSVPTSHSQLLAACTHMYIRPHGHFICRGNILSVWLLLLNASFSPSDRYSAHLKCYMNVVRNRRTITLQKIWLHLFMYVELPQCTALSLIIILPAMISTRSHAQLVTKRGTCISSGET